jgi:Protein of unknown function (DUF4058)
MHLVTRVCGELAMPVHDWSHIEAEIFHAFHQQWIIATSNVLNEGILPDNYYALPEQFAAGFGPDVLTLQGTQEHDNGSATPRSLNGGTGLLVKPPKFKPTAETDMEFYRRKQTSITVRHISGDRVVAMVEVVSPGNKSGPKALGIFVEKAASLLQNQVHLLIADVLPPGMQDPNGIHGAVWNEITGQDYEAPADQPLTMVAYESDLAIRAYVLHFAVGGTIPEMPLFLEPNGCVQVPLESTYYTAFRAMPRRWRQVLETNPS